MRLNPREETAKNVLIAAHKVDQAARNHRWADVDLACEVMVRHSQWVLKFEWNRVKMEAATGSELAKLEAAEIELKGDYDDFLKADGSLHRLKEIGSGKPEVFISLLRSELDRETSASAQKPLSP